MIRVLIVEDQRIIREYLENVIRADGRFALAASLGGARAAADACAAKPADLVLMDVMTERGESGLDAARAIKARRPETKIIVVTSLLDAAVLKKALEVGADSLWYKDAGEKELMRAIDRTLAGEHVFPDASPVVEIGLARSCEFTKKEIEVLRCAVMGMTYAEISRAMGVETAMVRYHISNMLQKTGFENKLQLALAVREAKLIANPI